MRQIKTTTSRSFRIIPALLLSLLLAGCAGTAARTQGQNGYVEVDNPTFTMSPGSPAKIWVPRASVDNGVPRGGELVKQGYESVKNAVTSTPPQAAPSAPVAAPAQPPLAPSQAGITELAGKPARMIPYFGLVVAVDGNRVYFNLGREAGYSMGQILKIHRGGTIVEGLGLAPGELIGTLEVQGHVGSQGGYGLLKQGGPVRINDLVGVE